MEDQAQPSRWRHICDAESQARACDNLRTGAWVARLLIDGIFRGRSVLRIGEHLAGERAGGKAGDRDEPRTAQAKRAFLRNIMSARQATRAEDMGAI